MPTFHDVYMGANGGQWTENDALESACYDYIANESYQWLDVSGVEIEDKARALQRMLNEIKIVAQDASQLDVANSLRRLRGIRLELDEFRRHPIQVYLPDIMMIVLIAALLLISVVLVGDIKTLLSAVLLLSFIVALFEQNQ